MLKISANSSKNGDGNSCNHKSYLIHELIARMLTSPNDYEHPDYEHKNNAAGIKYRLPQKWN